MCLTFQKIMNKLSTGMMPTTHAGSSRLPSLMNPESEPRFSSLNENCISANSPINTCTVPADLLPQASFTQSQKFSLNLGPINHSTYLSHPHGSQSSFSRSSTFCTTLHVSSPSSSDTNRQLGIPFLPFLSTPQPMCADKSSNSLIVREASDKCSSLNPEINFLEIGERSSDGRLEDFGYSEGSLALTEELEVGYMSDKHKIAINASEEVPRLDEIYEEWCMPVMTPPSISLACDRTGYSPSEQTQDMDHPRTSVEAINKTRMKWTSELHELFLDAVNKLDGFDKATPKSILLHMNVKGLNIYHVKSHLQKYRLTQKVQDLKQDEASSHINGKEPASISKNGDTKEMRGMLVTEALQMQLEFQKQLHEQLKVQNELQLCIERHVEYLQEILEEQKKAAKTLHVHNPPVSLSNGASSTLEAKDDCSSPEPKNQKAADCTETEQSKRQKLILNNDEETS